jgi:hypothetical protein
MLDVHVIVCAAPLDWRVRCMASIAEAIQACPFPVQLHCIQGEYSHIGRGRAKGYAAGVYPYVTCVDDDDYLLPFAFAQMAQALHDGARAVLNHEWLDFNGSRVHGKPGHHLTVLQRADVIEHGAWAACGDIAQARAVAEFGVTMPEPAYVHRVYTDSPARVLRRQHPDELSRAHG